jgi:hypothetical protein
LRELIWLSTSSAVTSRVREGRSWQCQPNRCDLDQPGVELTRRWACRPRHSGGAPGNHSGAIFATDIDNARQEYDFNINVGSTCGPPPQGKLGVNICTPIWNGQYANPVPITATARISGTLARMEVWVDGFKQYTETTSTSLSTTLTLQEGYRQVAVYAVNTAGTKWLT